MNTTLIWLDFSDQEADKTAGYINFEESANVVYLSEGTQSYAEFAANTMMALHSQTDATSTTYWQFSLSLKPSDEAGNGLFFAIQNIDLSWFKFYVIYDDGNVWFSFFFFFFFVCVVLFLFVRMFCLDSNINELRQTNKKIKKNKNIF